MNTVMLYTIRARKTAARPRMLRIIRRPSRLRWVWQCQHRSSGNGWQHPAASACSTLPGQSCRHPLTDGHLNARLAHCEEGVKGRFDRIAPTLKSIAGIPRGTDFAEQREVAAQWLDTRCRSRLLDDAVSGQDNEGTVACLGVCFRRYTAAQFR
ncbi:MAG: carboxysome shell carbonic anhydrase [Thiolinea sp.]